MATGSCLLLPTRSRLDEQRAREVRLDRTLVTQPFSPVLISSVFSDNGEEAVKVAAVEYIHHAGENPRRGVLELRRRPTELVEAREGGVEVGLVEDFAAVDQVAVDRQRLRSLATRRRSPVARSPMHVGYDRSEIV